MPNSHPLNILNHWYPKRDNHTWVLASIYQVQGSSYRKPGAFMLFNDLGQQFGMLSGGCLESDLQIHARKSMQTEQVVTVRYDTITEDNIAHQKALGCGGIVDIVLQPLSAANNYLNLLELRDLLISNHTAIYQLYLNTSNTVVSCENKIVTERAIPTTTFNKTKHRPFCSTATSQTSQQGLTLYTKIPPPPNLLIVGGGADAIPLATLASQLGWRTYLSDPRPANARQEQFPQVDIIDRELLKNDADKKKTDTLISSKHWLQKIDAAVVMTHNVNLDAKALKLLCQSKVQYCALLGPLHRQDEVLQIADITVDELPCKLHGPAGLNIGGELAESIALAILAQCHQTLYCPQ